MNLPFVRLKITDVYPDGEITTYRLMGRREFLEDSRWVRYSPDQKIAKAPYKLWQLWYLITIPAFYIERFLYRNLKVNETKKTHIAAIVGASIFDGVVGYYIAKLLDRSSTLKIALLTHLTYYNIR